jgi:hypothetical protein
MSPPMHRGVTLSTCSAVDDAIITRSIEKPLMRYCSNRHNQVSMHDVCSEGVRYGHAGKLRHFKHADITFISLNHAVFSTSNIEVHKSSGA